jgi:branched-chain amino acid transport system permease protein
VVTTSVSFLPMRGRWLGAAALALEHPLLMPGLFGLACLLPWGVSPYVLRIAILILVFYVLALGYNAIITDAGQFHLGYIAYFALGAYTVALLMRHHGTSFWWALLAAAGTTLAFSYLLGVPTLRFLGDYLSLVSLAFAEILRLVLINWRSLTRGYVGLPGIRPPALMGAEFSGITPFYFLILAIAAGSYLSARWLRFSRVGLVWSGICQHEGAVASVGIDPYRYKQLALAYGALLGAVAGGFFASFQTVVDPSIAAFDGTLLVLTIVILGGGHLLGLLAASAVLITLPEMFRVFALYRMLALGLFFIVIMNVRPEGFGVGITRHFRGRAGSQPVSPIPKANGPSATADIGTPPLLEIVSVTKRFGGLVAVNQVSFGVTPGTTLGIIGPNGAGKTTLLNMIAGLYRPTSGDIRLHDVSTVGWPAHRVAATGVGRTFQTLALWENLSLLDTIMLARVPQLRLRASRRQVVEHIDGAEAVLDFVGLWPRREDRVTSLPFGDRRRLELARALATSPRLLLLDEPSAGMVPIEVEWLIKTLQQIRARGVTIVCIEHNMRVISGTADRVVVLNYGSKLAEGPADAVFQDPRVIEAYLGRRAVGRLRGSRSRTVEDAARGPANA